MLDSYFKISERGSTVGREVRGGFVTFFTMAYIVALNPLISGLSKDADGKFIGGGEVSFGYMVGDAVRDKDAVGAILLMCEIAAQAKEKGSSVYKELEQLYVDYGFYKEHLISITKKGIDDLDQSLDLLKSLKKIINNIFNLELVESDEDELQSCFKILIFFL